MYLYMKQCHEFARRSVLVYEAYLKYHVTFEFSLEILMS